MPTGKKKEAVMFVFDLGFKNLPLAERLKFVGAQPGKIIVKFHF
jgi:hypothetical protein